MYSAKKPATNAPEPMHILMIAPEPFFRPRGTPFSVLHRIRGLTRLGHTVELVTYPFGESPSIPGLTIHRARRPPLVSDVGIGPTFAKIFLDGPLFVRAHALVRRGGFDLIHTHEEAGVLGAWIGRRMGIPHLYDMHSSLPQQFANFGRFDWAPVVAGFRGIERYILDGADGVIAICPELARHVRDSGYDRPLSMIENCLDFDPPPTRPDESEVLRRELGLEGSPVVLYTGTLESYQGLDLLLRAARLLRGPLPSARFVLLGGTPAQIDELRREAVRQEVADHVVFVPAVPPTEVFRYLRMADVLITTRSRGTNTPLKIYQYLRAGRPIVATSIRSHTQVLDEGCAELVAPEPAAIAAGLERVLTDPVRAGAIAAAAARLAEDRYSARSYLRALESLLSELPAPAGRRNAA